MNDTLELDGLAFEIRRSDRRRTLGLTVDRSGDLVVHAPTAVPLDELSRWVGTKLLWVHRKLALKSETALRLPAPEFVSGESFYYLGRRYPLKLVERQAEPLTFDGARFLLRRDARPAARHFRDWYISVGSDWLTRRVEMLTSRVGSRPQRIEVRDLGYRWGSCGRTGVIYFNWRILQLPVRLADYVIMHELIHLREGHHGPTFWAALGRAMPDWQERKNDLSVRAREFLVFGPQADERCGM